MPGFEKAIEMPLLVICEVLFEKNLIAHESNLRIGVTGVTVDIYLVLDTLLAVNPINCNWFWSYIEHARAAANLSN
jgi:hypothetical protein